MGTIDSTRQFARSATKSLPTFTERLQQRMSIEEAIKGAVRMLSAYPETAKDVSREYLMTLAETLCQFPLEVATIACSPVHGVPKQFKQFRPTAGQVSEWCEIQTEPLWERAKLETPKLPAPDYDQATCAERKAHVDRVLGRMTEKLKWPTGKSEPGWLSPEAAAEILAKYEREAKQNQSLDGDLV